MGYSKKHLRTALALSRRQSGVTARELAERIELSERLAKIILDDLVYDNPKVTYRERETTMRGPNPSAAVFVQQ